MTTSFVSTLGQYVVLAAVICGAILVYKPQLLQGLLSRASQNQEPGIADASQGTGKKKSKKGNATLERSNNSEDPQTKPKKRKITAPVDKTVTATRVDGQQKELPRDAEATMANKDFAEQMAKAQAGTDLQAKAKQNGPAASRLATSIQPSRPQKSGLTPGQIAKSDVDDEGYSTEEALEKPASGKDVSDMLEAPSVGPGSLRLTNVTEPKKKQAAKQFEEVQTKKQRQRQARKEEQKRLNRESERIHEQKKQDHLRQARMAAGTSNQTKADNFAANVQNAWQNRSQSTASAGQNGKVAPLLDTFEPSTPKESVQAQNLPDIAGRDRTNNNATALKSEVGEGPAKAVAASGRENGILADQLSVSEEEQMERVREQEQEAAWESVQSKKSKKKARKETDTSSEASLSISDAHPPKTTKTRVNGTPKPQETTNRFASIIVESSNGLSNDEWGA